MKAPNTTHGRPNTRWLYVVANGIRLSNMESDAPGHSGPAPRVPALVDVLCRCHLTQGLNYWRASWNWPFSKRGYLYGEQEARVARLSPWIWSLWHCHAVRKNWPNVWPSYRTYATDRPSDVHFCLPGSIATSMSSSTGSAKACAFRSVDENENLETGRITQHRIERLLLNDMHVHVPTKEGGIERLRTGVVVSSFYLHCTDVLWEASQASYDEPQLEVATVHRGRIRQGAQMFRGHRSSFVLPHRRNELRHPTSCLVRRGSRTNASSLGAPDMLGRTGPLQSGYSSFVRPGPYIGRFWTGVVVRSRTVEL
jgi:hypothetical protein